MQTLTTGQVSGLLSIPVCSLQRYVREFSKYFSESARQHHRGRRWTAEDVNLLMIIRKMHQAQAGPKNIEEALESYHQAAAPADPQPQVMDSFTLLATAAAVLEEVHAERVKVEALVLQAKWNEEQYKNFESYVERNFAVLHQAIDKLERAYYKLGSIFKNPLRRYPAAKPYRSQWEEFLSWTKRNILDEIRIYEGRSEEL
jgi:DNA-binding transcriptional MerR regulator